MSRRVLLALMAILVIGGALRLFLITDSPPGLHQDEAANGWNAWTLLKTGQDQTGEPWPLFYARCLGGNRSTLGIYYLMPFLAVGGLSVMVLRTAFALGAVASLAVTFLLGRRLFGTAAGLCAAGVLALNPWHLQQSRWAHEASLVPLLVALPLWLWLRAGLSPDGGTPCPRRGLLAGLVTGICAYGYPAVRPFFLAFFVLLGVTLLLGELRRARNAARTPESESEPESARGRPGLLRALTGWTLGLLLTAGPLVTAHVLDPEINRRLTDATTWVAGAPLLENLTAVASRYPGHFGPEFLFLRGDRLETQSPPGAGQFHLYALLFLVAGLVAVVLGWRKRPGVRFVAAWVLAYPAGDLLTRHQDIDGVISMHALRSLPGLPGLALLAGLGAAAGGAWLLQRNRRRFVLVASVVALAVVGTQARYLEDYYFRYPLRRAMYHGFYVDLIEATQRLRSDDPPDAVFCTVSGMVQPYIVTLVARAYDPEQWFADPKEIDRSQAWDVVRRYGSMHFLYDQRVTRHTAPLKENGVTDKVEFWVRPSGAGRLPPPVDVIRYPNGIEALVIVRTEM